MCQPECDIHVTGLRLFPLSLIGETYIRFNELHNNSIYTWDQMIDTFLERLFLVSKKLNKNYLLNNIVALLGDSWSSSSDRFSSFMRDVPYHRIDDESLNQYFYRE